MFTLTKDDGSGKELLGSYPTKEKALSARTEAVHEYLRDLESDGMADRYGVEDWMYGARDAEKAGRLDFYVDEGPGCAFNIEES